MKNIPWLKYFLWVFKAASALGVGVFFALLGRAFIGYSHFSFMFVFLTVFFAFLNLIGKLKWVGVFLVDGLFVLLIILVQMYVAASYNG